MDTMVKGVVPYAKEPPPLLAMGVLMVLSTYLFTQSLVNSSSLSSLPSPHSRLLVGRGIRPCSSFQDWRAFH